MDFNLGRAAALPYRAKLICGRAVLHASGAVTTAQTFNPRGVHTFFVYREVNE